MQNPPVFAARVDSAGAWLTVAAAFIVGFVVFGLQYSFGAFFDPMSLEFGAGRSAISAFFAVTGLVFYFAGPFTGHLGDRFGPRPMVVLGALLTAGGLAATALIGEMWVGYLTYGVGVGLGCACAYTPSLAIIGGWFVRRRTTAFGVAAAGTGCGTLALPPLAASMIVTHGWRATFLVLGGLCGVLLLVAGALVRPAPLAAVQIAQPLGRAVRSAPFVLLYFSWVCATTALFVPFVFLPAFARQHGADPVAAAALLSLLGAMGIAGRVGIGALAGRVGTIRLFKLAVFLMAASYLLWLPFTSYEWLAAFAAVLGLGYGIRIALMPAVLIELFGLARLGTLLGIFFTASGIAAFAGPMAAAAIVDRMGGYGWGIGFALMMGTLGFLALLPLRSTSPLTDRGGRSGTKRQSPAPPGPA